MMVTRTPGAAPAAPRVRREAKATAQVRVAAELDLFRREGPGRGRQELLRDGAVDEGFSDADADGVADCVGTEICDGLDNNADGRIDEGFDADGDGVRDAGEPGLPGVAVNVDVDFNGDSVYDGTLSTTTNSTACTSR